MLREENQKLKTHLTNSEKELLKFEKMLEEQTIQRDIKNYQSSEVNFNIKWDFYHQSEEIGEGTLILIQG